MPSVDHIPAGGFVSLKELFPHYVSANWSNFLAGRYVFDRRSKRRTVINRGALMFFMGHAGVHPCCVADATNDGAGLRLNGLNIVPFDFGISFDRFRTMRRCRLIWRRGDFVGAAFES